MLHKFKYRIIVYSVVYSNILEQMTVIIIYFPYILGLKFTTSKRKSMIIYFLTIMISFKYKYIYIDNLHFKLFSNQINKKSKKISMFLCIYIIFIGKYEKNKKEKC